jgi:predicted permease
MSGSLRPGSRIRQLRGRTEADARMDEEMRFHIEMETEKNVRSGMDPSEARRRALVAFGGLEKHRAEMRARRRGALLEDGWQDVRFGVRVLARSPGFTMAAILCLALGIGLNTAVFSLISALNFRPLPFPDPDELVTVHSQRADSWGWLTLSYPDLQDVRARASTLRGVAGYHGTAVNLSSGDDAERVVGAVVTPDLFGLLGVQPRLGRGFLPEEAGPAGQEVLVIGEELWRHRFASDPNILGREVRVNGRIRQVVGVMPEGFGFPESSRLWLPHRSDPNAVRDARSLLGIGRLRPGVELETARRELAEIGRRLAAEHPASHQGYLLGAEDLREGILDSQRRQLLWLMLAAVGVVLLIACANVANLVLARNARRRRELAIRVSIGAGRRRVVRQLLTEAVILSLAAGTLGVLLAVAFLRIMVARIPTPLPYFARFEMDHRVLAFTLGISVLTGLVFALLPALRASRPDLRQMLGDGQRSGGARGGGLRLALIVGQIAMSVLLLVSATLLIRSSIATVREDVGFDTSRMLTVRASLIGEAYDPVRTRADFFHEAVDRIGGMPGVAAVAAVSEIPGDRGGISTRVLTEAAADAGEDPLPGRYIASTPELLATLGQPLLAGRAFTRAEASDSAASVVLVSRTLAERLWPGVAPAGVIGNRLRLPQFAPETSFEVIGVAPDLFYRAIGEVAPNTDLQVHLPYARAGWRLMSLLVRTTDEPLTLAAPVRAEIRALDPDLALFDLRSMSEYMAYSNWEHRLSGEVFGLFGGMALLLALLGVYGVASYAVTQRAHEFGVRVALGARPPDILRLVLGEGAAAVAIGLLLGIPAAYGASIAMRGMLHGVESLDPVGFILVPLALATTVLLACALPARRAWKVLPREMLSRGGS